ncbi:MAG: O-antigen ligase family protein [Burkholderiales bacterium]|nr:O-antigen ligase family protein [Burkholderiales bacterium]
MSLALFLPLLEAPKNLAWLAYVGVWLWNRARARDFGGPWDLWDTLIALWIASGYLVAAFAPFDHAEWKGANDLLRYASILWLVKRGGYSVRELRWVLGALVLSALAAAALGFWKYWPAIRAGTGSALQLRSVGHVNHSAIYLAIVLGACTAWIFARWRAWTTAQRAAALAADGFLLVSLLVTASRGAIAAGLATCLLVAAAWWPRSRAPLVATLAAAALAAAALFAMRAEVVRKHEALAASDDILNVRDRIWRTGLAAWEHYPWFGVGMSNYSLIRPEDLGARYAETGRAFDATRYIQSAHGHNLFVNALAERGAVGAGVLFAVLAAWLVWLARLRPRADSSDDAWLLWGAAASGGLVTVLAGLVNTTLHHEHGILAALLLGLWLCSLTRRAS